MIEVCLTMALLMNLQVRATIVSSSDWNRVPAAALKLATPNAIANSLLVDPLSVFASDGTDVVNITDMHFRCIKSDNLLGNGLDAAHLS